MYVYKDMNTSVQMYTCTACSHVHLHSMFICTIVQQVHIYTCRACSHVHLYKMFTCALVQLVHMYTCTECSHVKDHGRTVGQQLIQDNEHLCLLLVHCDHIQFTHPPSLSFNISGFLGDYSTTTGTCPA